MWPLYKQHLKRRQNPYINLIHIVNGFSAPHGFELVARTSNAVRARISEYFLENSAFNKCQTVTFGHTSQTDKYPEIQMVNPVVWSFFRTGLVQAAGQLVSVDTVARRGKRLRTLGSHPFTKWQAGIDGLVACVPEDDYWTLPTPRRGKEKEEREKELPFWAALSAHCEQAEVGAEACRAIYEWMVPTDRQHGHRQRKSERMLCHAILDLGRRRPRSGSPGHCPLSERVHHLAEARRSRPRIAYSD
jgi:hypothetical protein